MPYAQFDDCYDDHKKTKRAWRRNPSAVGLHAMAITYCNRHKTDGLVDAEWVDEKLELSAVKPRDRQAVIDTLLEVGMFERDGDDYRVHDFLDWNRSRAQREALSEQGRRGGQAKAAANPKPPPSDGSSHGYSDGQAEAEPSPSEGSSTPRHGTPTPSNATSLSDADRADEKATDEDRHLCNLLTVKARERNPKFKVKSRGRWLTDMRLLRERDGNAAAEIEEAIEWVFLDAFWGGVIQSPGNLREHFAAIWDRMHAGANVVPIRSGKPSAGDLIRKLNESEAS